MLVQDGGLPLGRGNLRAPHPQLRTTLAVGPTKALTLP